MGQVPVSTLWLATTLTKVSYQVLQYLVFDHPTRWPRFPRLKAWCHSCKQVSLQGQLLPALTRSPPTMQVEILKCVDLSLANYLRTRTLKETQQLRTIPTRHHKRHLSLTKSHALRSPSFHAPQTNPNQMRLAGGVLPGVFEVHGREHVPFLRSRSRSTSLFKSSGRSGEDRCPNWMPFSLKPQTCRELSIVTEHSGMSSSV